MHITIGVPKKIVFLRRNLGHKMSLRYFAIVFIVSTELVMWTIEVYTPITGISHK